VVKAVLAAAGEVGLNIQAHTRTHCTNVHDHTNTYRRIRIYVQMNALPNVLPKTMSSYSAPPHLCLNSRNVSVLCDYL